VGRDRRLRRLILAVVAGLVTLCLPLASPASADHTGGGGEASRDDQRAGGEILDDGSGAEVVAEDGEDLGDPTVPRSGGGNVTCRWHELHGEEDAAGPPLDWSLLTNPPPDWVGQQVSVIRICSDGVSYESADIVTFTLPVSGPPANPRDLALMARNRLPFPLPDVAFSPPLDDPEDFLLVQLESWIWATNWADVSRTAEAGGVVATVTARPVRMTWDFTPRRSDPTTEGGCAGPGTQYDASKRPEEQSTACSITFRHSSAGEPGAAYEGHITVIYEVSWTSNLGVGGSLGTVPRTTVMPVRVGEQQALNESGGTQQ
jgi:hypothetical protein